jgi:hypothetical protein
VRVAALLSPVPAARLEPETEASDDWDDQTRIGLGDETLDDLAGRR